MQCAAKRSGHFESAHKHTFQKALLTDVRAERVKRERISGSGIVEVHLI